MERSVQKAMEITLETPIEVSVEISMNQLRQLSGLSTRSLRYYDQIGLLKPARVAPSGYRFYTREQVDLLQQILLYKELGFSLASIKSLLKAQDFDREQAFAKHLITLMAEQKRLASLIHNVETSLANMRGERSMTDQEKFEGFKKQKLAENEAKYGDEARQKYGEAAVSAANARFKGLSKAQFEAAEQLQADLESALTAALAQGDPAGEEAQRACDLHRQWLMVYYPAYNKDYHKALADMYVADPRFAKHYDRLGPGCAAFLRQAIHHYCG